MQEPHYLPGTTVAGHYTITGVLGAGGTAGVYRARDTVMNRTVAIKIIGGESPTTASRNFMTEARAAAVLSHPNIVNVYDVLELGEERYVIMEYVCGITLREYLDYHGHLSVKEAVNCAHQVLRALHAAHSRGIVHRDIKPGNILIATDGRIKVTDFGIARLPDRDSFLMPDRTVGTVHYVSPEQASGGAVDERSDLYSLGILMYEMLTGHRPFEAERPADVAMMQISTRPTPPTERNPNIPSSLERIVLCAMEKDPAARFDSAAEMIRMLDRLPEDLLTGRARPHREEGGAYRLAVERPDDRTMPLPKLRRRGTAEAVAVPPAEETSASAVEETPPPPPPPPPAPTPAPPPVAPAPPPPTPIGNMMDAFTAQDTVDIMLAPSEGVCASPSVEEAPGEAPEEPLVFSRRHDLATEEAEEDDLTVEQPLPPPVTAEEEKEDGEKPHSPLRGENKFFGFFMLLAALVLAVILLVGIFTGEGGDSDPSEGTYVSAPLTAEDPYAL